MSEEQANTNEEQKPQEDLVTLSKKEYSEMVQTMGEMKSLIESLAEKEEEKSRRDEVKAETERKSQSRPLELDALSRREFADVIYQRTINELGQPLLEAVALLHAKFEVLECKEKYPDFSELKDEIYKIAQANTSLSVEQAYLQAKAKKTLNTPPPPPKEKENKEPEYGGEKPKGPRARNAQDLSPMDIEDAAKKAMDDMKVRGLL